VIEQQQAIYLVEQILQATNQTRRYTKSFSPEVIWKVTEHRFGWLLFTQSTEWVHTRHVNTALIGGGPYLVDPDGNAYLIPVTTYLSERCW
jgi:hypothetical protein